MRFLLDTTVLIALARGELAELDSRIGAAVVSQDNVSFASAASIWEIAIKTRLRKLDPGLPLDDLPGYFEAIGLTLLSIDARHAVRSLDPEPATRDPFDRMLLAQCAVENLRLVTIDRSLSAHQLSWQPA
jgi:PIN domain nuclease of toxin-antitoxin system